MGYRDLDVLDAAERAATLLEQMIKRRPGRRLLHVSQLRRSVQAIAAAKAVIGTGRSKSRAAKRRRRSSTSGRTSARTVSSRASTGRSTICWWSSWRCWQRCWTA